MQSNNNNNLLTALKIEVILTISSYIWVSLVWPFWLSENHVCNFSSLYHGFGWKVLTILYSDMHQQLNFGGVDCM